MVPLVAVMLTVCAAGAAAFNCAVNVSGVAGIFNSADAEITSFTATSCCAGVPPGVITVILPLYGPAGRLVGSTPTVIWPRPVCAFVFPAGGLVVIQFLPAGLGST